MMIFSQYDDRFGGPDGFFYPVGKCLQTIYGCNHQKIPTVLVSFKQFTTNTWILDLVQSMYVFFSFLK